MISTRVFQPKRKDAKALREGGEDWEDLEDLEDRGNLETCETGETGKTWKRLGFCFAALTLVLGLRGLALCA
jgi:hypothetical protein